MPNVTLSVSDSLKENMDNFPEVSWSNVCRNAIENYLDSRSSSNPIARAKYLELKENEQGEGYKFGLDFSQLLVEETSYHEIRRIFAHIHYWEYVTYDDDWISSWIFDDVSDPYHVKYMKTFDEYSEKKGRLEWLLKKANQQEGFHKNLEFIEGMIKALREVFK